MNIIHINRIHHQIAKAAKHFSNKLLFSEQDIISDKDTLKYWKSNIFLIITMSMIIFGAPFMFFGAYMFYDRQGSIFYAVTEILMYIIIVAILTRKSFSVRFRKLFVTLALYVIGVLLLLTTGTMGCGMVFVLFSLILAGCLLEEKQIHLLAILNIIVFFILTILLENGHFVGTNMELYRNIWLINVIPPQVCGLVLIYLMNAMFSGLDNQTKLLKKSKESLIASEMKQMAMIANISDVIFIIDENGLVQYASPNLEQRFGWLPSDISKKPIWQDVVFVNQKDLKSEFMSLFEKDRLEKTMEAQYLCKDRGVRDIELTAVNLINDPNIKGILINFHDITERKAREARILYLSYQDSLTGLHNHTFFQIAKERLDVDSQLPLSVITGDINGLKKTNESLGQAQGDKVLIEIAKILNTIFRQDDIVARIGGDEFSILLPRTSKEVACKMMSKVNSACEEYNRKTLGEPFYISISMGLATKKCISESLDRVIHKAEDYMCKRKLLESKSFRSSIIASMKMTLFAKSQETEEHAHRLIELSRPVGQVFGLTNHQFDELELFCTLHDIGKIGIDDRILNKPGKLTDLEWVEMKKHAEVGYQIAMASPELMSIADYILTHHERWDGKGYPKGLAGENIPLLSRLLSVTDAYDAMTEDRPYRIGMCKQDAIAEIIKNSGTQFDPTIAKIFIEIENRED